MVTITLFKDIPFNNGCVMSNFLSFQDQKNYFDNYPTNKKMVLNDVKISKLDAPILINRDLSDLFNFTYGAINFNNKRIVYFSINRFEIETEFKTWMYIDIDYWETYRYPINNENGLRLGRGSISRCSLDLGCRLKRPYNKKYTITEKMFNIGLTDSYELICTYHDNETNIDFILNFSSNKISNLLGLDFSKFSFVYNDETFEIDPNEIMGAWINAVSPTRHNFISGTVNPPYSGIIDFRYRTFKDYASYMDGHIDNFANTYHLNGTNIQSTDEYTIGITDSTGNLIFTTDYGYYTGENSIIGMNISITVTSCKWFCYVAKDKGNGNIVYNDLECLFTICCEPVDIFTDAFKQYYTQQRPFNERQRQIQKDQALANSLTSMGTSAIGGAIAGSMVAPGIGTIAGAVAGLGSAGIGAGVNYATTTYFNKELQKVEDEQALTQTDNLRLEGSSVIEISNQRVGFWLVKIKPDPETINAYHNDIETNGYYYNTEYNDIDNLINSNISFKLTCICEVENVPAIAGISVKNRLQSGVKFIRPT